MSYQGLVEALEYEASLLELLAAVARRYPSTEPLGDVLRSGWEGDLESQAESNRLCGGECSWRTKSNTPTR